MEWREMHSHDHCGRASLSPEAGGARGEGRPPQKVICGLGYLWGARGRRERLDCILQERTWSSVARYQLWWTEKSRERGRQ